MLQYFGQGLRPAHLPQDRKLVCPGGGPPPPRGVAPEARSSCSRFSHVTQPGRRRWGERGRDTAWSHDPSCDATPEVRGNAAGTGGLGAVAACSRRARKACCTRPGLPTWGRGHGARDEAGEERGGGGPAARLGSPSVWRRVPGSGRPAWSVRRTTQLRNPPYGVWGHASAGWPCTGRLDCAFLPK